MSDQDDAPESLIPYDQWAQEALRAVAVRALEHAAAQGLPGDHHYYITFRTDHPGVQIPGHLRARYPEEMTIVLQYQFEELKVDRAAGRFSATLYFGGVPAKLSIAFEALTMFHDPQARFGLRFRAIGAPGAESEAEAAPEVMPEPPAVAAVQPTPSQVVSLEAFRRKPARDA
ncbi:MAG TPA: ClpXP protease specificity-enhancing factor SspB [Acetobacteraceae bacterium]|nr:ClpXP protease specificity-enhancing factor SspB [Acetobacteraceae bacterium]